MPGQAFNKSLFLKSKHIIVDAASAHLFVEMNVHCVL